MDSLGTICLVGIGLLVVLFVLPRLMRSFASTDYSQRGQERPENDDPNIRSGGGFGGSRGSGGLLRRRRQYDDPDIDSRGSFGGRGGSSSSGSWGGSSGSTGGTSSGGSLGGSSGQSSTRKDDPNIRSRGSFGGRKQ